MSYEGPLLEVFTDTEPPEPEVKRGSSLKFAELDDPDIIARREGWERNRANPILKMGALAVDQLTLQFYDTLDYMAADA
jgi:hypothetical protein